MHQHNLGITVLVAALLATAALLAAPMTQAQQPGAQPAPPEGQPPGQQPPAQQPPGAAQPDTAAVSDEQIDRFAEAYNEVAQLRDTYTQQIVQAEDPDKATELQQEANEKMVEAVEGSGLSVGEYNMIAESMDRDPELQQRVLERIQ